MGNFGGNVGFRTLTSVPQPNLLWAIGEKGLVREGQLIRILSYLCRIGGNPQEYGGIEALDCILIELLPLRKADVDARDMELVSVFVEQGRKIQVDDFVTVVEGCNT